MFSHARRNGILLMERREIDGVSLIQQKRCQKLFLRGGIAWQIEITYQPGRMERGLLVLDAQANFMQRSRTEQ